MNWVKIGSQYINLSQAQKVRLSVHPDGTPEASIVWAASVPDSSLYDDEARQLEAMLSAAAAHPPRPGREGETPWVEARTEAQEILDGPDELPEDLEPSGPGVPLAILERGARFRFRPGAREVYMVLIPGRTSGDAGVWRENEAGERVWHPYVAVGQTWPRPGQVTNASGWARVFPVGAEAGGE